MRTKKKLRTRKFNAYEDAQLWIGIAQAFALWLIFLTLYYRMH